jgi:hypothetical protein
LGYKVVEFFAESIARLIEALTEHTEFYKIEPRSSYEASLQWVNFMKHVIENNDGYRIFCVKMNPSKEKRACRSFSD